jgi:DNA mismatch repair protein MSH6
MECLVEEGKASNITFLYTLGEGVCPKSFGINVARLAGVPEEVLKIAEHKSSAFEEELCGTVEEDKINKEITAAVESGDILTAECLWDKLSNTSAC